MKAIVLVGGLGTRLREAVPEIPKPMAPIAGRPFLEYILDQLVAAATEEIILSVGYKSEIIRNHFGDAYRDIPLVYVKETEPLGTGGAIVHAVQERKIRDPLMVLNGDTWLGIDYANLARWYKQKPADIAITLAEVSDVLRYGSVKLAMDRVIEFREKDQKGPGLINAGTYIVQPQVFGQLSLAEHFSFEDDVLRACCGSLYIRAMVSNAYFIDIGIPEDYRRAQMEFPKP